MAKESRSLCSTLSELDQGYDVVLSRCQENPATMQLVRKVFEENIQDPVTLEIKEPPLVVASDGQLYSLKTIQQLILHKLPSPYTNMMLRNVVRRSLGAEMLAHHLNILPKCDIATPEWIALREHEWSGSMLSMRISTTDSVFWSALANLVPQIRLPRKQNHIQVHIRVRKNADDSFDACGPSVIKGLEHFSKQLAHELGVSRILTNPESIVSATFVEDGLVSLEDELVKSLMSPTTKINGMKKSIIVRTLQICSLHGSPF